MLGFFVLSARCACTSSSTRLAPCSTIGTPVPGCADAPANEVVRPDRAELILKMRTNEEHVAVLGVGDAGTHPTQLGDGVVEAQSGAVLQIELIPPREWVVESLRDNVATEVDPEFGAECVEDVLPRKVRDLFPVLKLVGLDAADRYQHGHCVLGWIW